VSDDHSFHLTPLDVRSQEFARTLRGYDRAQVDEFKQAISEELERLLRDRGQHEERLRSAQEQLRAFRDRERAMNEALVAAQQLRVDSREQAEREAELVLREARAEAEGILERAHQEEALVRMALPASSPLTSRASVPCWSAIWVKWTASSAESVLIPQPPPTTPCLGELNDDRHRVRADPGGGGCGSPLQHARA
jgi:DivIVA domain-containing protein